VVSSGHHRRNRSTCCYRRTPDLEQPAVIPFDLDHEDPATDLTSQDDATSTLDSSQAKLLRWHYRLGHLPFGNICLMAAKGEIPKRLATCRFPRCHSCLYGRATKKPWQTKAQPNKIRTVTRPGQCFLVDQLESPIPGLKGQNKGFFFREQYKVATIFVDHFSRLLYVYLQESIKGKETLLAKRAFEAYATSFTTLTKGDLQSANFWTTLRATDRVSLFVDNAHFQNGIAKKRIWDLTKQARDLLTPRHEQMAIGSDDQFVAVCTVICQRHL
jgi:hypothetical protein